MRILTNSEIEIKGLISIVEADENAEQIPIFCIPVDKQIADNITDIYSFEEYFFMGITTKIIDNNNTRTIDLRYLPAKGNTLYPRFEAKIRTHRVDFYLSPLNFNKINNHLNIDFFYCGKYLHDDLRNKKLIILEPNWKQLDKLYLESKIIFRDWT